MRTSKICRYAAGVAAIALLACGNAQAQTPAEAGASDSAAANAGAGEFGDIIVTATKRGDETVQTAPLAITAFGSEQLAAQQFRSLESLAFSAPNVQLSTGGALPGTANFTIRGLGIASTIPSIDPTVGIFVDGIYQGVTVGSVYDTFDLEGIEVLRGPQGLLFGKNVTGGAVLLRTTKPKNDLYVDTRFSVETGTNVTGQAVVSGPIVRDLLQVKVAAYYNYDQGWFRNQFTGRDLGGGRTWLLRGALRLTPSDAVEIIGRYEHGKNTLFDGPTTQNRARFPADSFKLEQSVGADLGGIASWDAASLEANIDTGFGDGTITSITGYRKLKVDNGFDTDGLREFFFHSYNYTRQDQWSQELRYAGTFGNFDVTLGGYYFTQDVTYIEHRKLGNGTIQVVDLIGGGTQHTKTLGAFAAVDWHVSDVFTINLGGRYTEEKKRAEIARIRAAGCNVVTLTCNADFNDKVTFDGFTPRIGFQWKPNRDTQVYGFWTEGFRSGGYNLRNTAVAIPPGPFKDERQSAFEAGVKLDLAGGRVRINAAAFYNRMRGLQREIILPDPVVGVVQVIANTADATIKGLELETTVRVGGGLTVFGTLGITDGKYRKVVADLNRDGVISDADKNLKIPRLAPLTYSIGASFTQPVGFGTLDARASFAFRDDSYYTDSNAPGTLLSRSDILDASVALTIDEHFTLSVYGRNLLNDVTQNTNAALPPSFGGPGASLTVLNRGRVYGVSGRYRF